MAVGVSARDCNVFFNYDGQSAEKEEIKKCERAIFIVSGFSVVG